MAYNTPKNKMSRKIKLLGIIAILSILVVSVSSCSKEKKIVGKWKVTSATGDFLEDKGNTWTFKENGKCTIPTGELEIDGEWTISSDNLTIDINQPLTIEGYNCNIKGTADFDIETLSNKEMSLSGNVNLKLYYQNVLVESEAMKGSYDFEKK